MTSRANAGNQARVAIVDDDPRVLESLTDLLESAGYAVRPFSTATELIAQDELGSVDCLITDVTLPGMTGLELEELVQRERPELPVVLITGHEGTWAQAQAVSRGRPLRFLLRKPLDGNALLAVINTLSC